MRLRTLSIVSLFLCALLLAPDAFARGGRYSGPAGASPRGPAEPASASEAPPTHNDCDPPPAPVTDAPDVDNPGPSLGGDTTGRRSVRTSRKRPGLADWSYWYDANREEFEDLRRGAHLTEANPLFALGGVLGQRVERPVRRLDDPSVRTLRDAVEGVLVHENKHWIYTEGAAYVALGKIATEASEVERMIRALERETGTTQFVRESAALGLGQLRRTEKKRQLAGTTLDPARAAMRAALGDEDRAPRTRAFAAVSLGLLSDQPSADPKAGRATADALLRLWTTRDLPDETQVGILVALGLHRPDDVSSLARLALTSCVLRGTLGSRSCSGLVRGHAALALARVGTEKDAPALVDVLEGKRDRPAVLEQAAAIAAGVYGRRFADARPALAKALLRAEASSKDPGGRHVALIALGRLLAMDVRDGAETLLTGTKAGRLLLAETREGTTDSRAFAALALALAVRDVDGHVESVKQQEMRVDAVIALRKGLVDKGLDGHARGAFATALGVARDEQSRDSLLALLSHDGNDPELRAHAALGLGLIGSARVDVVRAIAGALKDARSDNLRTRATTALGLLGGGKKSDRERTIAILIEQLRVTRNQHVKGQIAITLARIGDARAVRPLVAMLEGTAEPHLNRSLACAALGLLGDEERTPVLSEARRDSHYMSGSAVVFDLLDVL